jgi:CBS domain containing-hemolysin-like protein
MSDDSKASEPKRGKFWSRIAHRLRKPKDATLRESLEGVFESHEAQNPQAGVKDDAKSMMMKLIAFADLRVDDVMVPRADLIAIEDKATMRELLDRLTEANHSRLPVYRETLDDLIGMIHVKDFLRWMKVKGAAPKKKTVKAAALSLSAVDLGQTVKQSNLMRELLFVPPSMPASDLLVKMQSTHIHLAIVVDEYGGTDGLVSFEDLVEEIVGDISDEHDEDDELIKALDGGVYLADARADLEELEEILGVDLLPDEDEEEADTLGGLVFSMLGRVPARGEIVKHSSGIEFEILDADPRRVKRIRIHTRVRPAELSAPAG